MAQHFLLSRAARSISLAQVARMTDEAAWEAFKAIRWAETDGAPFCPRCGCLKHSFIATRKLFKCAGCRHQYSIASGTIFASRKLPIRDHLLPIAIFANGAKGHSALQLSRDLNVQYRTAFVMAHKLREAVVAEAAEATVSGVVEVDGAYFSGHVRPENMKADRKDRRLAENQTGKRRVVVVIRERKGKALTFAFRSESESVEMIETRVAPGSIIHADESKGWDRLHKTFKTHCINHQVAYSADEACTNRQIVLLPPPSFRDGRLPPHRRTVPRSLRCGDGVARELPPRQQRRAVPDDRGRLAPSPAVTGVEGLLAAPLPSEGGA